MDFKNRNQPHLLKGDKSIIRKEYKIIALTKFICNLGINLNRKTSCNSRIEKDQNSNSAY
jgi:hypothetical protein